MTHDDEISQMTFDQGYGFDVKVVAEEPLIDYEKDIQKDTDGGAK